MYFVGDFLKIESNLHVDRQSHALNSTIIIFNKRICLVCILHNMFTDTDLSHLILIYLCVFYLASYL